MRILLCLLTAVLMSGCFEAADGQFLCADESCPEGTRCFDGVCRVNAPDAVDGGEVDGGPDPDGGSVDAGPVDARVDAGPVREEDCTPNEIGAAVDEDGDGAIDEECLWFFGEPHLVEGANLAEGDVFALAFSEARDVAYLSAHATDSVVQQIRRTNIRLPFAPDAQRVSLMGTEPPPGNRNSMVTVSADGLLLMAQSTPLVAWERDTIIDSFVVATDLNLPTGGVVHPSLSPDGLELYYAMGSPRRIFRVRRSSRDLGFGPPEQVNVGVDGAGSVHFPRVSSDGFTLFFTNQRGIEAATRDSLSEPFEGGEILSPDLPTEFISPTYLPDLREMWMVAIPGVAWSPPAYSVWRVQVCRDGPCEVEPRPTCNSRPSNSGFSCYLAPAAQRSWGGASDVCATIDSRLASISSAEELALVRGFGLTDRWLGMSRMTSEFAWQSGEPLLYLPWNTGQPSLDMNMECVVLSGDGFSNQPCGNVNPVLCERRALPRWMDEVP